MRKALLFAVALGGALAVPATSQAQGFTPQIGVYVPGSDLKSVRSGFSDVEAKSEGTLALGFNVEFGFLRASVAYASNAKLTDKGVTGETEVGEGKLLAVAGDIVFRPVPRLVIVQPYLLVGGGLRRSDYSWTDDGFENAFPDSESKFALHAGIGADIKLGPVGLTAEFTDFISKDLDDKFGRHDAFAMVGLKLGL